MNHYWRFGDRFIADGLPYAQVACSRVPIAEMQTMILSRSGQPLTNWACCYCREWPGFRRLELYQRPEVP